MNKIDEQPDRASHASEVGIAATSPVSASFPIISETSPLPAMAMDLRSEGNSSFPTVASRTASRRAWLRRGVAVASPVVVSLVSGPVYAAEGCILPSGFISQITFDSRHPGGTVCMSMSITTLSNNLGSWPVNPPPNTKTALFSTIFGGSPEAGMVPATSTLKDVLKSGSPLARYSIAAYLNARITPGFPLTPDQAVAIYKSYRGGGFSTLLVSGWLEGQTVLWLQMLIKP